MKKLFIGLTLLAIIAVISGKIEDPQFIFDKIRHSIILNRLPKALEKWRDLRAKETQEPSEKLNKKMFKLARKIYGTYLTLRRIEKQYPQLKGRQKIENQYGQTINSIKNIIKNIIRKSLIEKAIY